MFFDGQIRVDIVEQPNQILFDCILTFYFHIFTVTFTLFPIIFSKFRRSLNLTLDISLSLLGFFQIFLIVDFINFLCFLLN